MTVNDYKETACATATGSVEEDMEVETEPTLQTPAPQQDSENLLGRVLAGKKHCFFCLAWRCLGGNWPIGNVYFSVSK